MKKKILRVLVASLVTLVMALWPRDYYFAPCIRWNRLIPNARLCDSFWVTWWTELGWPKKWFLLVGGGKYGGDPTINNKTFGQDLAINFGLAIVALKIGQLIIRKWGVKNVVSGLAVIGIVSMVAGVVQSDQFQFLLKPPFPLDERGARYEIHWSGSGVYVFLGPPTTESSSTYSLYYFPQAAGQSPKWVPIFKHPANIDKFEIGEIGEHAIKHLEVRGRFRKEVGVVKCSEFPCKKFKVTGIDIDKIEIVLPLLNTLSYP